MQHFEHKMQVVMKVNYEILENALVKCAQIYNGCVPFLSGDTFSWRNTTEYCVNITENLVTIVFRGTDSKAEWTSNLAFCRKKLPYGNAKSHVMVHSGFIDAYNNEFVRTRIHKLIPDKRCRVIVSGHSRGAALAALCAVDLQYNFPYLDIAVYLFGCPRVGNKAFAKSYNKRVCRTVRVQNGNDIVTKLPPAIFGYRHVGAAVNIGKARIPFAVSFKAHYPEEYFAGIIRGKDRLS